MNKKLLILILLIATLNLSAQWNKIVSGTTKNINAVTFASNNIAVAVGDSGLILRSQNTGNSFSIIASSTVKNLNDVFFLDANNGFIVGDGGTILKTINGGISWSTITSNSSNDLTSIDIKNSIGLVVGRNGTILKSVNNGANWTALTPFTIFLLNKVKFASNDVAIISGSNGLVLKSTDAGYNWTTENSSTGKSINDFAFYPDDTTMIFVGSNGLKIDADTSFKQIQESTISSVWLNSIHHLKNNDTCFVVGKNASILFTINGNNFNSVSVNSTEDFNDISFVNDTTGLIVGGKGTIFKTITGGVSNDINELEKISVALYPNPSTNYFTLSGLSDDSSQLKIFNSCGQLVFEQTVQGNNAMIEHTLPTGIYYINIFNRNTTSSAVLMVY